MKAYIITEPVTKIGIEVIRGIIDKHDFDRVSLVLPVVSYRDTRAAFNEFWGCEEINMIIVECPEGTASATLDRFHLGFQLNSVIILPPERMYAPVEQLKKENKSIINSLELAKKYKSGNVIYLKESMSAFKKEEYISTSLYLKEKYCDFYSLEYKMKVIKVNTKEEVLENV